MKIYTFDDKTEEIAKSYAAIKAAGHEVADASRFDSSRVAEELALEVDYERAEFLSQSLFFEIKQAVGVMKHEKGGIITDLMFHNTRHKAGDSLPPAGLLVVIHAIARGVPVVVCTNADEEEWGHHSKALRWIFDGYVTHFTGGEQPPFGWVENKDWGWAVEMLAEMRAKIDNPSVTS